MLLPNSKQITCFVFQSTFMRTAESDLKDIKELMERSSRFISLSGLSGVFAGVYALIGAWVAKFYVFTSNKDFSEQIEYGNLEHLPLVLIIAASVLVLSITTAILLTTKKARKNFINEIPAKVKRGVFGQFAGQIINRLNCYIFFRIKCRLQFSGFRIIIIKWIIDCGSAFG